MYTSGTKKKCMCARPIPSMDPAPSRIDERAALSKNSCIAATMAATAGVVIEGVTELATAEAMSLEKV